MFEQISKITGVKMMAIIHFSTPVSQFFKVAALTKVGSEVLRGGDDVGSEVLRTGGNGGVFGGLKG
jgi:hypothetical protein